MIKHACTLLMCRADVAFLNCRMAALALDQCSQEATNSVDKFTSAM